MVCINPKLIMMVIILFFLNPFLVYSLTVIQPFGPQLCHELGQLSGNNISTFNPHTLACTMKAEYLIHHKHKQEGQKHSKTKKSNIEIHSELPHHEMQMRCVMCTDIPKPMKRESCQCVDGHTVCSFIDDHAACVFTSKISEVGRDERNTNKETGVIFDLHCGRESGFTRKQRQMLCLMLSRLLSVKSKQRRQTKAGDVILADIGTMCKTVVSKPNTNECGIFFNVVGRYIRSSQPSQLQDLVITNPGMLNCRSYGGMTPIMMATRNIDTYLKAFNLLLGLGADLSIVDDSGNNIIHRAADNDVVVVLKVLFELGMDIEKKSSVEGLTPLLIAARAQRIKSIDYLISKGSNVNATTRSGSSLLNEALAERDSVVQHILEKNISSLEIEARNSLGETLVLKAARKGDVKLVKYLLSLGCNMSAVDDLGNTILHVSVLSRSVDTVKYVVSKKIVKLDCKNYQEQTPLMMAVRLECDKIASYLQSIMP